MTHPILGQIALAYCPVIDRARTVTATRLTVFPLRPDAQLDAPQLLDALAEAWPSGGAPLWVKVAQEALLQSVMDAQPSSHIALEIPAFMALRPQHAEILSTLHANGNALLLNGKPLSELPKALLPAFTQAIIDFDDDHRLDETSGGAGVTPSGVQRQIGFVQGGVRNVSDMETSFRRGAVAVLGWPIDDAIKVGNKPADQPALQVIVQLIDQ
jgi:EAL and modified HD-GYP domain-containing signal transduction protein